VRPLADLVELLGPLVIEPRSRSGPRHTAFEQEVVILPQRHQEDSLKNSGT
jgi:hypothetical protein